MTKGEKHKNPGNIKRSMDDPFRGQVGVDEEGHAIFSEMRYGVRAMIRSLQRKALNGKKTPAAICYEWTGVEKDRAPYAAFVADFIGVRTETPLGIFSSIQGSITDCSRLVGMIQAMSSFENGHWMPRFSDILLGMADFQADFIEKKPG